MDGSIKTKRKNKKNRKSTSDMRFSVGDEGFEPPTLSV